MGDEARPWRDDGAGGGAPVCLRGRFGLTSGNPARIVPCSRAREEERGNRGARVARASCAVFAGAGVAPSQPRASLSRSSGRRRMRRARGHIGIGGAVHMGFPALKKVSSVGLLANTVSPLGIDFGVGSLKVLQVGLGEPPTMTAAACVETPDEILADHAKRLEFQSEALLRLVKSGGFKSKRAICSI